MTKNSIKQRKRRAGKPLAALDLALNHAENCKDYYDVTERHYIPVQFESEALGGFSALPL